MGSPIKKMGVADKNNGISDENIRVADEILGSPMKQEVGSPMKWGLRWVSDDDDFFQDSVWTKGYLDYQSSDQFLFYPLYHAYLI